MLLTSSLIALLLGPLLFRLIEQKPKLMGALDAFIFVVIGGLVLFHMLPNILEQGGWWAVMFLALGLSVPTLLERLFHQIAKQAHAGAMLFAALGLGLHGMTDGAALAEVSVHEEQHLLALGVILHRLPVGLTIWWLLRPHFGILLPTVVLTGIGVSTLVGHSMAEQWLPLLDGETVARFESLVVGTILHVVFHRPYHEDHGHHHEPEQQDWLQGIGSLVGVAVLLAILLPHWLDHEAHSHGHDLSQQSSNAYVLENLLELSLTLAPWLLLAYLLAAIINFWFPRPFASVYGPPVAQALRGALTGLPLPICVPNASKLYKMLIQQGAGPTYAVAFLMASPLLGIDALLLSWGLLGSEWMLWRLSVTLLFALIMAWLVGCWLNRQTDVSSELALEPLEQQFGKRLQKAIRHGYAHLIDHTAPWVIVGLIVASLLPVMNHLEHLPFIPVLLLLLCICLPFHLCATGMTPVLAVLLLNGFSPLLALIILLIGPAVNWSLIKLIAQLHGKVNAALIIALLLGLALLFALFMPVWPEVGGHHEHLHEHGLWHYLSLALLLLLYAGSLLRQGARAFVAELLPSGWLPHKH